MTPKEQAREITRQIFVEGCSLGHANQLICETLAERDQEIEWLTNLCRSLEYECERLNGIETQLIFEKDASHALHAQLGVLMTALERAIQAEKTIDSNESPARCSKHRHSFLNELDASREDLFRLIDPTFSR